MTIKATIIADSISNGSRITTFELEYPRWIHAEILTHRLFSRNAASSRAIPVSKTAKQVKSNPERPIIWGTNKPGMQSTGEITGTKLLLVKAVWNATAWLAGSSSILLSKLGLHKQWANRVAEYAQTYKVVVTSTEFDNFFHLRKHKDAQPEIKELAELMYVAVKLNDPTLLKEGEWHLPYITTKFSDDNTIIYSSNGVDLTLEEAQQVSASCCAQISYRQLDVSLEKAKKIFIMLIKAEVIHASPFEHLATPITNKDNFISVEDWDEGVTHVDKYGEFWSGNLRGWIQYRHLITNNTCTEYKNL